MIKPLRGDDTAAVSAAGLSPAGRRSIGSADRARPARRNHRLPERITAHFMICYTALLVYRLLEARLDSQGTHVTPEHLIQTLKTLLLLNFF